MLHDKMTKEELLTLALFDNGGIDDTDLYRDTTDSTYESVKTLSNCGAFPMLSLTAEINAVQDLHGYDHPWVGGAGKNKLEFSLADCKSMTQNSGATWSGNVLSHAGVNFSVEEDGTVKTNGTASSNAILQYAYITPSVSGDYIINGLPQDGGDDTFEIMLVDGTFTTLIEPNSVASGTTVTLTAGKRYGVQIIFRNGYNSNGLTFKPMIRLSTETDATFEPYSNICPISGWDEANITVADDDTDPTVSNTYTIDLDGTRYGGTLDVVSGVLTVDRAMVDLGTLTWTKYNVAEGTLYRAFIDTIKRTNTPADLPNIVCSHYPVKSQTNRAEKTISQPTNNSAVDIIDSTYADATAFKTAMNGVQLVYELATPTTIQLTPTQVKSLLGTNNIWADTGDVGDVRYFKKVEL